MTAGKRRTAREMAIQMLYQSDLGGSALPHIFNTFDLAEYVNSEMAAEGKRRSGPADPGSEKDEAGERAAARARARKRAEDAFVYAQGLVRGVIENVERVDEMIRSQADHWRLERMPAVDRNVLRLAVYEMLYESETPKLVVLDEAIELAKKFG